MHLAGPLVQSCSLVDGRVMRTASPDCGGVSTVGLEITSEWTQALSRHLA